MPNRSSSALSLAITQLYAVFNDEQALQQPLNVCTACCMSAEQELEMRHLPRRELTDKHFYRYNDSAWSNMQPTAEMKYFLPRMLELLAQGEDLHHSTEITLQRLGNCDLADFNCVERAAIDAYALAFFADGLRQWPCQPHPRFMGDDAFTTLLMFEFGAIVDLLLAHWLQDNSDTATLHFACATYWNYWETGRMNDEFANPFAYEREEYQKVMATWLLAPENRQHFAQRIRNFDYTAAQLANGNVYYFKLTLEEVLRAAYDLLVTKV